LRLNDYISLKLKYQVKTVYDYRLTINAISKRLENSVKLGLEPKLREHSLLLGSVELALGLLILNMIPQTYCYF